MTDNSKLIQGTPEWHAARRGKITGTGFAKVLSTRGDTRKNYMRQLILERKTGITAESFSNEAMEWGVKTEPQARAYYESLSQEEVRQVGFIDYKPKSQVEGLEFGNYVGVSPDGLVADQNVEGIIEIKCPNTKTHLEYIAKNVLPSIYKPQVQGLLWVTNRQFCNFISFDPRVEKQPYWCIRIYREQFYIDKLAAAVSVFIDEMVKMQLEIKDVDPQLLMDVTGGCSEEDWALKSQMEIRGKVRHGVVCAMIQNDDRQTVILDNKEYVNKIVDFIIDGK